MIVALEPEDDFQVAPTKLGIGDEIGVGRQRAELLLVRAFGRDDRPTVAPVDFHGHGNHAPAPADRAGDHMIAPAPEHLSRAEELKVGAVDSHDGGPTAGDWVCAAIAL